MAKKNFSEIYNSDIGEYAFTVSLKREKGRPVIYVPEGESVEVVFQDDEDFVVSNFTISDSGILSKEDIEERKEMKENYEEEELEVEDEEEEEDDEVEEDDDINSPLDLPDYPDDDTIEDWTNYILETLEEDTFTDGETFDSFLETFKEAYGVEDFYESEDEDVESLQILLSIERFMNRTYLMQKDGYHYDTEGITAGEPELRYTNPNTEKEVRFYSVKDIKEFLQHECFLTSGEMESLLKLKLYSSTSIDQVTGEQYIDTYYIASFNMLVKVRWTFNEDDNQYEGEGSIYWYSFNEEEKCFYDFPISCTAVV